MIDYLNFKRGLICNKIANFLGADLNQDTINTLIYASTKSKENRSKGLDWLKDMATKICDGYIENIEDTIDDDGRLSIYTKDGVIRVCKMSTALNCFTDKGLDELECDERGDKCHRGSVCIANAYADGEVDVVTGFVGNTGKFGKYLHSWVEMQDSNGTDVCLDWTKNAIIDKESYYKLMCIEDPNLCVIPNEVIKRERDKFFELYDKSEWFTKFYLYKHDEAMEYYERCVESDYSNELI